MFGDSNWLLSGLMNLVPLVLSLTVHEWAHAYSAYRLGDDTAARMGRLTLNPVVHMDPIGTFLLPMLGVPFGWAKPVPVNPARFRRDVTMSTGMMLTAAAGPASNLVIAFICSVVFGLLLRSESDLVAPGQGLGVLLLKAIMLNVSLAIFNMLPIPPLDGSRVVDGLLPYRFRSQWESVHRVAPLLLLGVIFIGQGLISVPMQYVMQGLYYVIQQAAGM